MSLSATRLYADVYQVSILLLIQWGNRTHPPQLHFRESLTRLNRGVSESSCLFSCSSPRTRTPPPFLYEICGTRRRSFARSVIARYAGISSAFMQKFLRDPYHVDKRRDHLRGSREQRHPLVTLRKYALIDSKCIAWDMLIPMLCHVFRLLYAYLGALERKSEAYPQPNGFSSCLEG